MCFWKTNPSGIGRGKVCMATRHFWWLEIDAPMHVLQQYVEHVHACASVRMCSVCLAGNTSVGTRDCPINPHRGRNRPDGALEKMHVCMYVYKYMSFLTYMFIFLCICVCVYVCVWYVFRETRVV